MARPSKFSDDYIDIFKERMEEWLHDGGFLSNVYIGLGISKDTFYRWKDQHEEFKDLVKTFEERSENLYEKALGSKALGLPGSKGMDTMALLTIINNKSKGAYRQNNTESGNTFNIGSVNVLETLSNPELLGKIKQISEKYHLVLDDEQQELVESDQ